MIHYTPKYPSDPFLCGNCNKWHVTLSAIGCAVYHAPGDCCHYADVEISGPDANVAEEIEAHRTRKTEYRFYTFA